MGSSKIHKMAILLCLTASFLLGATAEARKSRHRTAKNRSSTKARAQNSGYKSAAHNKDFLNTCSKSIPTVYNPNKDTAMEGGKMNRMDSKVTSIEDAAKSGAPVTVAMDMYGDFGAKCNYKNSDGTKTRRCLMLVNVPGLDRTYPAYGKKFPQLPKDTFLAIVEDTGGAFFHKGTGKIDIPFRKNGLDSANNFKSASFQIIQAGITNGNAVRKGDFSHKNFFLNDAKPICEFDVARNLDEGSSIYKTAANAGRN